MRSWAVTAGMLAVALIACGGGGKAKPPACMATSSIDTIDATKFAPVCAQVAAGATVKWRNADAVPHTVTFTSGGDFDKYFEKKDEIVSRTFDTAGTFAYYCKIHGRRMAGKIVVTAA